METQTCIVSPVEDGFDIEVASQDINLVQWQVSQVLNIPANSVNVSVKRLGGAYGAKVVLTLHVVSAAAVAANKLNRPIRLWMNLEDNMRMLGKRNFYLMDYRMGLTTGKIVGLESSIYSNSGWNFNDGDSATAAIYSQSCYKIPNIRLSSFGIKTHTQTPTAARYLEFILNQTKQWV